MGRPPPGGPLRAVLRPLWTAPAREREKILPRCRTLSAGRKYGKGTALCRPLPFAVAALSFSGDFRAGYFRLSPNISNHPRKQEAGRFPSFCVCRCSLPLARLNFATPFAAHFVAAKSTANSPANHPANTPANGKRRGCHRHHACLLFREYLAQLDKATVKGVDLCHIVPSVVLVGQQLSVLQ